MATDFISNVPFYIIVIGIFIIIMLKIKSDADSRRENPGYRNNYRPHVKYKASRYVDDIEDDDIYEDEYERELARLEARKEINAQNRADREYEQEQIRAERAREEYGRRVAKNVFGYERR